MVLSARMALIGQSYEAPKLACLKRVGTINTLDWRLPVVGCGSFNSHDIYVSNTRSGPYVLLTSITNPTAVSYSHIGITPSSVYYYYMMSNYNCPGKTSTSSDTFSNATLPAPRLISISIENNRPVYTWEPVANRVEVYGYIAAIEGVKVVGYINSRDSSRFVDTAFNGQSGPYQGGIAARDSCDDPGYRLNRTGTFEQRTCFLSVQNNPCGNSINLAWTAYKGWDVVDGVKEYQVLLTKNSDPEKIINVNDPTTKAYVFSDFKYGDTINIRIKAIHPTDNSICSYSNNFYLISNKSQAPDVFRVMSASYLNNYQVKVYWYCDPTTRPKFFNFLQLKVSNNQLVRKASNVKFYAEGNGFYYAIDDLGNSQYLTDYVVEMEDSCNNKYQSDFANTNFLNLIQIGAFKNDLSWPEVFFHDSVKYTIKARELYFTVDGANYTKIVDLDPTVKTYRHEYSSLLQSDGNFCYKLLTKYTLDTSWHVLDSNREVWSQSACIPVRTVMWVPNAFKVNGVTPTFKPKLVFFTSNEFMMKIYNRWGAMIFETNDPNLGWNGIMNNGSQAPEDGYIYHISYIGNDGVRVDKTGNFVLFR
jgi:gliding motility-associated-like protein